MSQKIKVQDGVIVYSNTDPAGTVDFTISGNLNINTINGAAYPPPAGGIPGGSSTQVQYNNNGQFGGIPNMLWDSARSLLLFKSPNEYIYDLGTLGTVLTQDLDVNVSNNFCCTLGSNISFNFIGAQYFDPPPTRSMIQSITIYVQQDASGNRIPTWPAGVYWQDGTIPEASITPSAIDIYTFITYTGGTIWLGFQQAKGIVNVI